MIHRLLLRYIVSGLLGGALLGPVVALGDRAAGNICIDPHARTWFSTAQNYRALSALPLDASTDFVMVAEKHETLPGVRHALVQQLMTDSSKKTCLFYELSHKSTIEAELGRFNASKMYADVWKEFNELHQVARANKLTEILVDYAHRSLDEDVPLNQRDAVMAANIHRAFDEGSCEKGILFVGEDHAVAGTAGRIPLPKLLRQQGLNLMLLRLQNADEHRLTQLGNEYRGLLSWNGLCPARKKLPRPNEPQVLRLHKVPQSWRLTPYGDPGGRWSDFDWLILVTQSRSFEGIGKINP